MGIGWNVDGTHAMSIDATRPFTARSDTDTSTLAREHKCTQGLAEGDWRGVLNLRGLLRALLGIVEGCGVAVVIRQQQAGRICLRVRSRPEREFSRKVRAQQ